MSAAQSSPASMDRLVHQRPRGPWHPVLALLGMAQCFYLPCVSGPHLALIQVDVGSQERWLFLKHLSAVY